MSVKQWIKIFTSNERQVAVEMVNEEDDVSVKFRWKEDDFSVDVGRSFNTGDDDKNDELQRIFFEKVDQNITDSMVLGILEQLNLE